MGASTAGGHAGTTALRGRTLTGLGTTVQAGCWVLVALALLIFAFAVDQYMADAAYQVTPEDSSEEEAAYSASVAADGRFQNTVTIALVAALVVGLLFIGWLFRAMRNLDAFGVRQPVMKPSWAWWSWVIPIANLWLPHKAVAYTARASSSDRTLPIADQHRRIGTPAIVHWWWAAYLLASLLALSPVAFYRAEDLINYYRFSFVTPCVIAVPCVLAALLVRRITRQQAALSSAPHSDLND